MPSGSSSTWCTLRAALAQRQQRAVVGGALDHHVVAAVHDVLEQERVRLHRAVGDEHALRSSTPWRSAIHARSRG